MMVCHNVWTLAKRIARTMAEALSGGQVMVLLTADAIPQPHPVFRELLHFGTTTGHPSKYVTNEGLHIIPPMFPTGACQLLPN